MSGSLDAMSGSDELRRRFALWTLAIVGSLSGTGAVQLRSPLWAAQDPPTGLPLDTDENDLAAKSNTLQLNRLTLDRMVAQGRWKEAKELVSRTLTEGATEDQTMQAVQFANSLSHVRLADARELYGQLIELLASKLSPQSSAQVLASYVLAIQGLSAVQNLEHDVDGAMGTLREGIERTKTLQPNSPFKQALPTMLAQLYVEHDRADAARELLDQQVELAKERLAGQATASNRRELAIAASNFIRIVGELFHEEATALLAEIEPVLLSAAQHADATAEDYRAYQSIELAHATMLAESDPTRALELLAPLDQLSDKLAERFDESDVKQLAGAQGLLRSARERIECKRVHQQLIGTAAPEIPLEANIDWPHKSLEELKGKVVLIDFWAVWCVACIADFPHLRQLHERYADRGLVIVGVTRRYGYTWDKNNDHHLVDKQATLAQELEMLAHFIAEHRLPYGVAVTPPQSDFYKKWGVFGLPQLALLDKDGKVQLVTTRRDRTAAQQLEATIQSLLGAKEP